MRRCQQRILAAGDVATDGVDRNILVTKNDTRQRLDLDILHRIALMLSEIADLLLSELDVIDVPPGQLPNAILDLGISQPVVLAIPLVELHRQFPNRVIATLLDVRKNPFN
ncbi:Uncharacterised protein [Mycobacterium tuberculosis]|nr:Uncharacterised protein [Mycobacterium tuberculosis]